MLTADERANLLEIVLSQQYLFYRIDEEEMDSLFTRSFGSLIISAIIAKDASDRLLQTNQLEVTINKMIEYAQREKDRRGVIDTKAWAHSVAHTADALGACAQHPRTTIAQQESILQTIFHLANLPFPFMQHEDDRLAYTGLRLAQRDKFYHVD